MNIDAEQLADIIIDCDSNNGGLDFSDEVLLQEVWCFPLRDSLFRRVPRQEAIFIKKSVPLCFNKMIPNLRVHRLILT